MDTIILAESGTSIVAAKKTAQKKYKCPYCELRVERSKLHIHIQDEHEDMIPDGYTALRVAFNTINHKTEGHCIICKGVTDWNEDKGRYERLCDKPACHEAYKKLVAERTRRIYGTDRLQTDPKYADYVQKKALEGRKMSGKYKFTDGGEVSFMGTYERKFLEFMDQVMHCESEDILAPGPSIKYQFQGQTHIYISDFYYVPYNLIIEIKDGGRNRNTHPKRLGEEEEKIKAKEKAVADLKMFNYVRVTDNNFGQLMTIMALLKYQLSHPAMFKDDYIIRVNESTLLENVLFNRKDIYYNKDKFESGEINLCFITGHSGSGKSTMGRSMQEKYNVEHYELDDLQLIADHFTLDNLKEYGDLIYSYFTGPGKQFYVGKEWIMKNNPSEAEYEDKLYPGFVHYAMRYAKCHDNKRFVLEGVWLLNNKWFKPSEFDPYAFYIKGTSMIVSKIRGAKRDSSEKKGFDRAKSFTRQMANNWKWYIRDEKWISSFVNHFSRLVNVSEASISEDMSGTIAAALPPNGSNINLAPNPIPHESDPDNYYLVQHPKKDKVSYSITKDPLQYSMISVDPEEKGFYKVYKTDKGKLDKKYVTFKIKDKQSAKELYNELAKIAESTQEIHDSSFKSSDYIYEALTGGGIILDPSQIMCDNRFELVDNLDEKEKKSMAKLYAWLKGTKLDKLEEQVEQLNPIPSDEDIDYNVLPDGPMSLEQLKIWKDAFDTMTIDQRIISNDLSTKKYGADCVSRYNSKYAHAMENIPPEVGIKEADETTPIDSSMSEYQAKLDKVKSVESEGSILIMVLTDRTYSYELYDSKDIEDLKDKWNRYLALPEEQRVLSSQTAGTIFGVDNESLFNRAINSYMSKQATSMEDIAPTDESYLPYYIPSMKVMNSNPEGIFTNEGYIDTYKYTKLIQEFQYELKHAKTEADRETIKSKIIDYGWNPEIACLESALKRVKVMYDNLNKIQEIDAKSFLEAQDATSQIPDGLTSEYLKDKIVPIFVVLVSGQKLHSKGIKWLTDSEWSHASLSLESSLDEMYTFTTGIDNAPNKRHRTGFAIDTKERYLREDPHMKVKVYALFITPEQKANIKEAIKWYIDHQDETAYSFKSILNIFFRKPTKRKMKSGDKCKMICSQFVYSILSLVNFRMRKSKDGSTISPADIDELSNDTRFYTVYQGGIDKYDQLKVDDLCYRLLPTLPMDIYGITESTDVSRKFINNKFNKILGIANQLLND